MEKPNFHEVHKERNAHKEVANSLGDLLPIDSKNDLENLQKIHKEFKVKDYENFSGAKKELRFQKEQFEGRNVAIDHELIHKALGSKKYEELDTLEKQEKDIRVLVLERAKRLRAMTSSPSNTKLYQSLVNAITEDTITRQNETALFREGNPEIARIFDLLSYREQLYEQGHIAEVPSVKKYLDKIEEAMIEGKSMFLHGPTGTGKTSLAIRASKLLTGKDPEIVYCNPQTKESNVFGKTGIGIDEKSEKQITEFDPGPLVRAMENGGVVIFDEFTALPKEVMAMLKGIMNAKQGDTRTVTGDGQVTIAPGFQMIFTANLKSEKNPERQDIPPEMANEFSQNNLEIRYQTVGESYDIVLARLLSPDGTIAMSPYDVDTTLPKLCEAIAEIQKTYTEGSTSDVGSKEGLKKYVLNQRNLENIISRWKTASLKGEATDFVSFLDEQLAVTLTFREYSEKDRLLAAKILARHGLLSTKTTEDVGLPPGSFSFRPEIKEGIVKKSKNVQQYTLEEVADIDPFNVRRPKIAEDIDALTGGVEVKNELHKDVPEFIKNLLQQIGTPATLDDSFEGGIINLEIDQNLVESLSTWDKAQKAYKGADGASPSWIWEELKGIPYTKPEVSNLDVLVLNHKGTKPQERDKLVSDMEKAGYRPLEFSELIALGIIKPEYNKRNEILNTYKKYTLGGGLQVPFLRWSGDERELNADRCGSEWSGHVRFLFVRK